MFSGATPGRRFPRAFGHSKVHRYRPQPVGGIHARFIKTDIPGTDR
jgi:hypothetical protein